MWLLQPFCLKRADYWRMALRLLDMCLSVGWQSSREQITIDHETPFSYCLSHDFKHSVTVIMHLLHIGCSSSKSKFVIVMIVINLLRSWVNEETLILWGILIPFEQYEKKLQRANQSATGGLDPATLFSQVNNLITLANQSLPKTGLRAAVLSLTHEMSIGKIWCQFWNFFLNWDNYNEFPH